MKYTSDNKKVVIVGKLNNTETIVQEIFITKDGSEIPSGENFVVKSLHDTPVISWKEQHVIDVENRYNIKTKEYESNLNKLTKEYNKKSQDLRLQLQTFEQYLKLKPDDFNILINYMSGNIKYIILESYSQIELHEYSEFYKIYDDKLRLVSLFGNSKGDLKYNINNYYDNSGSNTSIHFYDSYESAIKDLQHILFYKSYYSNENIKLAEKHKIELNKEVLNKTIQTQLETLEKNKVSYEKRIQEDNLKIQELKNNLK